MPNDGSVESGNGKRDNLDDLPDIEKQSPDIEKQSPGRDHGGDNSDGRVITIVVSSGDAFNHVSVDSETTGKPRTDAESTNGEVANVESEKKCHLSRNGSSHEQCRVCQQEKEEELTDLGCLCRGGLAKAHKSCIETWFLTRGSNRCEICLQIAANVPFSESHPNTSYWVWRVDPTFRGTAIAQERRRICITPIWVAFSILIVGLLFDVLISMTLGVSALPVRIIIGAIAVLGIGTALRVALDFCHERIARRREHRMEANTSLGYHPAL